MNYFWKCCYIIISNQSLLYLSTLSLLIRSLSITYVLILWIILFVEWVSVLIFFCVAWSDKTNEDEETFKINCIMPTTFHVWNSNRNKQSWVQVIFILYIDYGVGIKWTSIKKLRKSNTVRVCWWSIDYVRAFLKKLLPSFRQKRKFITRNFW